MDQLNGLCPKGNGAYQVGLKVRSYMWKCWEIE